MTAQTKSLVIYEIAKGKKIEVPIKKETVWLNASQMADLFSKDIKTIYEHISNVYKEKELLKNQLSGISRQFN